MDERIIVKTKKYDVIKKFSHYYIRFIGGQMMPIPCDIKITDNEKDRILEGKTSIENVISDYMQIIPWTQMEFMRRGFEDFFHYRFSMKSDEIEEIMAKLDLNKALKNEMYISIMNEKFPIKCWAKVEGMNAVQYSKKLGLNLDDTYMYMIRLL